MKSVLLTASSRKESGNIFALLFGGVALVGVLGMATMNTLGGPVKTMARVTQSNLAKNQLMMSAALLVHVAGGSDADFDGIIEPRPYRAAGALPAPVGGGLLPDNLGLSLTDPWGVQYGLCVWDHGAVTVSTGRLEGDNTAGASAQIVLAVVSAGEDRQFQTTCADYAGGPVGADKSGSDDLIFQYSYAEASLIGGGLWTLNTADANTAELKDGAGSVAVTVDRSGGIVSAVAVEAATISAPASAGDTLQIGGGLMLDTTAGAADTCGLGQAGALRLDATKTGLEMCDGAAWAAFRAVPVAPGNDKALLFNDGGTVAHVAGVNWDKTTSQLFIGPESTAGQNYRARVVGEGAETALGIERASSDINAPKLVFTKSRGTNAAPLAAANGDNLGQIAFLAHEGAGLPNDATAANGLLQFRLSGAGGSATAQATAFRLYLKENGNTENTQRLSILADGSTTFAAPNLTVWRNTEDSGGATLALRKTRGTPETPEAVQTGDTIGAIVMSGRHGTGNAGGTQTTAQAAILAVQTGTAAANVNMGADLRFRTLADGSTSNGERMRITSAGLVGIGTTGPESMLHVAGAVQVGTDTAACVTAKNGAIRFNAGALEVCSGTAWAVPGAPFAGALAMRNIHQTIATGTDTALNLNAEDYDTDGFHSTVTNNSRLTIPAAFAGRRVILRASVRFEANATGARSAYISRNGGGTGSPGLGELTTAAAPSGVTTLNIASAPVLAVAGDYYELRVFQDSGVSLQATSAGTWFSVEVVD